MRRGWWPLLAVLVGVLVAGLLPAVARAQTTFGPSAADSEPIGAAVDQSSGDVFIAARRTDQVDEFSGQGALLGTFGKSGSGPGELSSPSGVAVDQATGDVYVVDTGNDRVQEFDSAGNFVLMFGDDVDKTTGADVCTAASGDTCGAGTTGTADGQFSAWPTGSFIGVDGAGTVYVGDANRIEEFDSSGDYTGQITLSGSGDTDALAVDASGDVYEVSASVAGVREWSPSGTLLNTLDSSGTPQALAVDGSGDLFVRDDAGGSNHFLEYNPSGTQTEAFPGGSIVGTAGGLAYGDSAGVLYAVDGATTLTGSSNDVEIVSPPPPGPFLEPGSEQPTNVQLTTATLTATLNPEGQATTYHFDYGTTDSYGHSTPESSIGADFQDHTASATLTGLTPGTTYHFRVVATNPAGTIDGPDLTFTTYAPVAPQSCPNAGFRIGPGANLPDCRAYEQVSPVDKNDSDATNGPADAVASDGDVIAFTSQGAFAGAQGNSDPTGNMYLSTRGASGWSTDGIEPAYSNPDALLGVVLWSGWSADLSHALATVSVPEEPTDVYLRGPDGSLTFLNPGGSATPVGVSADSSHVLLKSTAALTPNAPNDNNLKLYEWTGGQLTLVSVLPDGTPSDGQAANTINGLAATPNASISADGSRVFWADSGTTPAGVVPLYVSQDGSSTEITTSQCTTASTGQRGPGGNCLADGASGTGTFVTAATDGSVAIFTSSQELTNDANTGTGGGKDLYEYDVQTGTLTDVSPDSNPSDAQGAYVKGLVGASADGSYVYFVAEGALASGASPVECIDLAHLVSPCNLYVWHDGTIKFIAPLSAADDSDWSDNNISYAQVSADGTHLLFESKAPTSSLIPGSTYDNADHTEVYMYDAGSGTVTCLSCNPSGAPATGDASLSPSGQAPLVNMSPDGQRVFFDSTDALLPQDTDGQDNVYEWEADGDGSCQSSVENGGCLYLISSGQSDSPSFFVGASPSGDDVFFATRQELVGQDDDDLVDIYDARVDGGLASQNPPSPPAPCSGDQCQGTPSTPPPAPTAASVSFTGPGNVAPGSTPKPKPTPKPKVVARTVRGTRFFVRVRVPGRGTITIAGAGIKTVRHSVAKAGTYRLKIALTSKERKALKRKHRLRLKLRVGYAPPGGAKSQARFSLTVKAGGAK